jgi:lipid-binding SYLF domain-containing protein
VVVWSDTKGAFAGASFGVTQISRDEDQNQAYYNRTVSAQDVFTGKVAKPASTPIGNVLTG